MFQGLFGRPAGNTSSSEGGLIPEEENSAALRRHSTSELPSQTSTEFQAQLNQVAEEEDEKQEEEKQEEQADGGGGAEATPQKRVSLAETPMASSASRQVQSEPRPALSSTSLMREDSHTDYGEAAMKFLRVVKKVQRIQRVERLMRQASAPATSMPGRPGLMAFRESSTRTAKSAPHEPSERTPMISERDGDTPVDSMDSADMEGEGQITVTGYLMEVVFGKGIVSLCLLATPFALWAVYNDWGPIWIFWLNFLVMIPLAAILGDFTEEVALHTNQTIGGLINATFGNAVEVVVAVQALLANEIRVVQSSMLGSIFSNLLLVLGGCFFFGGLRYREQKFNATAATANMALLALSGIALVLPTPFADYYDLHDEHVLLVSRFAAIFLMFMYVQLLIFQLKTHADIFDDGNGDDELAAIPFWVAGLGLLVTTACITIFSDYLVDSIDGFVEASGISRTFVGIIILPIVGNAVEHVTAVTVAMKNKMDLAMGVAVGSCTQISLFVVPLTVLVGWMTDRDMTLNFPHFEVILFVMSVFTVSVVLSTPKCNWLEGSLLMTTYLLIAVGFWFENVQSYGR